MTLEQKYQKLLAAAEKLSAEMVEAEANGFEVPEKVDRAWARLTAAIQNHYNR